jgi:hypothetical protein
MLMTNQNPLRCIRFKLLILPLGLALSGLGQHSAQAQPQTPGLSCSAALNSLMAEWQSIGFVEPSKPAQTIVAGQHGYRTTGGQYNFMRQEIRAGARDCTSGSDATALQHINTVRELLEHAHSL